MRLRLSMIAVAALVGYGLLLLVLWHQQDRLVFPGAGLGVRPIDVPLIEVTTLGGLDGAPFRVAQRVPAAPRAVIAFFVGNGEDLCSAARRVEALVAHGVAAVAPEYPGYGDSPGRPGVAALMAVAEATAGHARALAARLGVPMLVGGISLGTFCALHVAQAGEAQRCLLLAPPTSMVEAAGHRFWWLPVGLLLRHRFDNLAVAPRVRCPALIVHGDQDRIVPLQQGERLRARLGGPAELVVVPGAGHNDLSVAPDGAAGARIGAFLLGA